MFDKLLYMV